MRAKRVLTAAAGVATLTLALAGCSGDASGDDLSWEDSPLNVYLSAGYGTAMSEEEMQERSERQNKESENLIAACMSDQGFEYQPNIQSSSFVYSGEEYDPTSDDFVAEYGYGAVDGPWNNSAEPEPTTEWVDPNQDYVESLSASEQNAYWEALYGPQPSEEDMAAMEDGTYEWDWTKSGCSGEAQNEVYGDDSGSIYAQPEWESLMSSVDTFYTSVWEGSAFDELNGVWAACMGEAGYPQFTRAEEAPQSIYDEVNAYYESLTGEYDTEDPKLKEIQAREIPLATADMACRKQIDYDSERLRIQFKLEEQFIADHKAELEAYKLAAEQQSSDD